MAGEGDETPQLGQPGSQSELLPLGAGRSSSLLGVGPASPEHQGDGANAETPVFEYPLFPTPTIYGMRGALWPPPLHLRDIDPDMFYPDPEYAGLHGQTPETLVAVLGQFPPAPPVAPSVAGAPPGSPHPALPVRQRGVAFVPPPPPPPQRGPGGAL
eukprot:15464203-Alexandrium_andersonii.AAC.1